MCEFISWVEVDKEAFYLTKDDLRGKKFNDYKKYNAKWRRDIMGHGAIEYFYPDIKGKHMECIDFSTPDNFPDNIVDDIKLGEFEDLGVCEDILNAKGKARYEKIRQSARNKYDKIAQSTWNEYKKIKQSAWNKYEKIQQSAWNEYDKIVQSAFWSIAKQRKYRNRNWK